MIETTKGRLGQFPRGLMAGILALSVVGSTTAPATARQAASVCRVQFTGLSTVRYNPGLNLTGFIIMGQHNYDSTTRSGGAASTDFEVLDNDGYLTLIMLMNEWQASGKLGRNQTRIVTYPRSDILLALDAASMGVAYHRILAGMVEREQPENATTILSLLALKTEAMTALEQGLRSALDRSPGGVDLPPGFLTARLGVILDGLHPGPGQFIQTQYLDRPTGDGPNILCNADARSVVIGQVFCGTRFTDGAARDAAFCPEGVRLNQLSSLPRCRRIGQQDQC